MITPEQMLRELLAEGTPRPWSDESDRGVVYSLANGAATIAVMINEHKAENSRLIVAAVNALPALIDRLEEAEAEVAKQTRIAKGAMRAVQDIIGDTDRIAGTMEKLRASYYSGGDVVSLGVQDAERLMLIHEVLGPEDSKSWARWALRELPPEEVAARRARLRDVLVQALAALDDGEGT